MGRRCIALLTAAALGACSAETPDGQEGTTPTPATSMPDRVASTPGGLATAATPAPQPPDRFARTMPQAVRGQWRLDDLGRAPTSADCTTAGPNIGKVMDVRDTGYGVFETGGRITAVHNRTDTTIDATFDTTYADTPTSARKDFAAQNDGTLIVNDDDDDDDGDGRLSVRSFRRCPGER